MSEGANLPAAAAAPPPPAATELRREEPEPAAAAPLPPPPPLPYQEMLRSTAYGRMRAEHPEEFAPVSVFFMHHPRSDIDRRKSFRVKAALVYEAVTGHHTDDHKRAISMLVALAKECHSRIFQAPTTGDAAAGGEGDASKSRDATSTPSSDKQETDDKGKSNNAPAAEVTDDVGWDERQKRVVDGIFLVVGFLPKLNEAIAKSGGDRDGVDEIFKSQHMHDIVTDVVKLENQLPLRDLIDVAGVVEDAVRKTVAGAGEYKLPYAMYSLGDVVRDFLPKLNEAIAKSGIAEAFKSQHMHDIVTDVVKIKNQLPQRDLIDVAGVVEDAVRKTVAGAGEYKLPNAMYSFGDVVRDFLPKLNEAIAKSGIAETFKSQHMHNIVTDVVKLGNQLPLRDLIDVARVVEEAVRKTVAAMYSFADVVGDFCWYYSPFSYSRKAAASPFKGVSAGDPMAARTLLDCLHMSVVKPPQGAGASGGGVATGRPSRMPTARELRRSGVRIQASETGRAEVEFAQPAVRLPALVYDFKLATVVRNLLAREYDDEQSKPVTRYFQMMNELVEEDADVRILRRAGVVRGVPQLQEVRGLIKGIDRHATYPSLYMAMDREIEKVRKYHDQRMASFFVRNRPGVIWASSVTAISVVAIVAARRNRGVTLRETAPVP